MKLIVANWKMQLGAKASVILTRSLVRVLATKKVLPEIVLCPSFPALALVHQVLDRCPIKLGAQDLFWQAKGAFTGEVSPTELKEVGCRYVIIGHSERRAMGEIDQQINKKVIAALSAGLTPIICVGETAAEHQAGKTLPVVSRQVHEALRDLHLRAKESLVFAYEPVWAIGSGRTPEPMDVVSVHEHIHEGVQKVIPGIKPKQIRVLYGGSVDAKNCASFLTTSGVDGLLVGGASLKTTSLTAILAAAA